MSAADYSWGAGDVLGKLRAAEAEVSRLRETVADIQAMIAEPEWHIEVALGGSHYVNDRIRAALGGAA